MDEAVEELPKARLRSRLRQVSLTNYFLDNQKCIQKFRNFHRPK